MARLKGSKNKTKVVEHSFTIVLRVNGETHTITADTLKEALLNIPIIIPKTKAVFTISIDGGKVGKSFIFNIPRFKRLFYPGMTGKIQRIQFIKQYEMYV